MICRYKLYQFEILTKEYSQFMVVGPGLDVSMVFRNSREAEIKALDMYQRQTVMQKCIRLFQIVTP